MVESNGSYRECPFFEKENCDAIAQITETHEMVSKINLVMEPIGKLNSIDTTLSDIKMSLLAAATGRDQVPLTVVQSLIKMVGWIIFGLVAILVFVLTGHHLGWVNL